MFVDRAAIRVIGGRGGHGCVSFRREKRVSHGGPDGGNGGDGGSVYLLATFDADTLSKLVHKTEYRAENGGEGKGKKMYGRGGKDLIIPVAVGTIVFLQETGTVLCDLDRDGARACVARGGKGGRGNAMFATLTDRTPRRAERGTDPEDRRLQLELKLVADVGIIGYPNAGKSTLLSAVSAARPKIADYPFTTLHPYLGTVELEDGRSFTMADIPGLVEGAHQGKGLGHEFLRHIERTRILLHLVDAGQEKPGEAYRSIRAELGLYNESLLSRPEIVVASKMDLPNAEEGLQALREATGQEVLAISAVRHEGIAPLIAALDGILRKTPLSL